MDASLAKLLAVAGAVYLWCLWLLLTSEVLEVTPPQMWAQAQAWWWETRVGQLLRERRTQLLSVQMRAVWAAPVIKLKVKR